MKNLFILCINIYQETLSPDHGIARAFFPFGVCRFYPSCSERTKVSIKQDGIIKGIAAGFTQFMRCHPFQLGIKKKVLNRKDILNTKY